MKHAKLAVSVALGLALVGVPAVVVFAQTPPSASSASSGPQSPPPPPEERRVFVDRRDDKGGPGDKNKLIERSEARGPLKEHFDEIDTNKDGKLSHDELVAFHKTHGPPDGPWGCRDEGRPRADGTKPGPEAGRPPRMGSPMEMVDKNADGKVSRDEFLKGQSELFDRLDANKDGFLTADERPAPRHMEGRCPPPPGDMPPPPPGK